MSSDILDRARANHALVLTATEDRRRADHTYALVLAEMQDEGQLRALGYATLAEYARAFLDITPAVAGELARAGRKLRQLPVLGAAFAAGEVVWSKVREIVRVATPETERAWVDVAARSTCREVERRVAGSHVGDAPPVEPEPLPVRSRVWIEMEAADAEVFREMLRVLRAQAGEPDAEVGPLLADLARRVLAEAPREVAPTGEGPTGEPYRIVLQTCPSCGAAQTADAGASETVMAEACCDAEVIDAQPGPNQGTASRVIAPRVRRMVLIRDNWCCTVPGCRNRSWLHLHHEKPLAQGGKSTADNLRTLCGTHHRLLHEGLLALERLPDGRSRFRFGDGREVVGEAA